MKNNAFLPLEGFPFFHLSDPDPARSILNQTLGPLAIDSIGRPRAFDWRVNGIAVGPLMLFSGRMLGGWSFQGELSHYMIQVARRGHARFVDRQGETNTFPGGAGCVMSPATRVDWRVEVEISSLSVRIDRPFLEAQLELLTGVRPSRPLCFTPQLSADTPSGASLQRLLRFLIGEVGQEAAALVHPVVATSLSEMVVRSLLLGQPHSASRLLEKPAPGVGPRWVRMLEEYMEAHAAEPVSMADLARLSGTSVRSIQAAFRAHRGCSPMAFLRTKRMELSRRALLSPLPFTSVTNVAYASGFLQPGQFSVDYRKRFGESPSQTLHRGRALVGHLPGHARLTPASASAP